MADVTPRWKNGGQPPVDDWPEAREHRLYVDKGLCQAKFTGCHGAAYHVHHRRPSDRRTGDHAHDRLISLCAYCHYRIHSSVLWSVRHGWLLRSGCEGDYVTGCDLSCEVDHRV